MADDPTIHWKQATPFGIQADEAQDAWHSGHATDVLELDKGTSGLIVATQTGGVWVIDTNGSSLPLSDTWDNPDVTCLASGPDGSRHFFAGTTQAPSAAQGVIWETDTANAFPLFAWQPVSPALPDEAGGVNRIVVIRGLRRIVVACSGGLYWAVIPEPSFGSPPPPRKPYVWKRAEGEDQPKDGYHDLAVGSTQGNLERDNLEDRSFITIVAGGESGGIFVGQWDLALDVLVMKPAGLEDKQAGDIRFLFSSAGACSVDSCEQEPNIFYAACAGTDGSLYLILRSRDGGRTWTLGSWMTDSTPHRDISKLAGAQGNDYNNCIAVSRTFSSHVAIGWEYGPFLSIDGAQTWKQVPNDNGFHWHLHPDLHALHFSPTTPDDVYYLFVCSDGGVARIDLNQFLDPHPPGQPFQSNYNRLLPTLQCLSPSRGFSAVPSQMQTFYGTFAASAREPGLIAIGLQDNGNVHCWLGPSLTPWVDIDGGDGGWNTFLTDGALLHNTQSGPVAASGIVPGIIATEIIPPALNEPVGEPVIRPSYRNAAGQLLTAVAAVANQVYGLFADDRAVPRYHWELIATLPAELTIGALGSFHGGSIFVGTLETGKMFVIETARGQLGVLELPVKLPRPTPTTPMDGGSCTRIVAFSQTDYFAVLNGARATFTTISGFKKTVTAHYVLRLNELWWEPTHGLGLPGDLIYGLEAVVAPNVSAQLPRALFVATDDRVYISRDDGENWQGASQGLPRRPHCTDLRFVVDGSGGANLFLSTYGRSVWVVRL